VWSENTCLAIIFGASGVAVCSAVFASIDTCIDADNMLVVNLNLTLPISSVSTVVMRSVVTVLKGDTRLKY